MNKIIKTVKKEDKSFDSSALRKANPNIEVYSPEELAHFGILGMRWGVRKDQASGGLRSAHQKNQEDEEKSINEAAYKAMSLANKKYSKVYNAMAKESTEFYSKINNKPEYKGKNVLNNKKYLDECAAAATKSLQQHSDRILGNKVDSRVAVKWYIDDLASSMPSFYIERVGSEIKHSEDISDDKIKLSVKFNGLGQIEKISLPSGSEKYFISDEGEEDETDESMANRVIIKDEFSHTGVLGMKWGVRKGPSANTQVRKSRAKMYKNRRTLSDAELKKAVGRMQMEKKLKGLVEDDLIPGKMAAKSFMSNVGSTFVGAAAGAAGAALVKAYLAKKGIGG